MRHTLAIAAVSFAFSVLAGCGPNVLSARTTCTNPLVKDHVRLRIAVIVRKEPVLSAAGFVIVGARKPRAAGWLEEPAEIIDQTTNGRGLLIETKIYSIHCDELKLRNYSYVLVTSDGQRIKGRIDRLWPMVNLTEKITGMGRYPTYVEKRGSGSNQTSVQRYEMREVENVAELCTRKVRVLFVVTDDDPPIFTLETKWLLFVMTGDSRERRYRFDLEQQPPDEGDPKYEIIEDDEPDYRIDR